MDSQSDVIKQIQQRGNCEYMGAPLYNSFNFFYFNIFVTKC